MISLKCALLAFGLSLVGCAGEDATEAPQGATGTCPSGKCDGLADKVQDYYDDMRSLSLDDLTGLSMGLATDQLNDVLSNVPYLDVELEPTAFLGDPRTVFDQATVQDLKALTAGLTQRLGENAFATRINAMRQATLEGAAYDVFAESRFRIRGELNHAWSMDLGDAIGTVGFGGRPSLEAVVIAPYNGNLEAAWRNPLATLKNLQGFVLRRVGTPGCPGAPLTEPDLWASHPALQPSISNPGNRSWPVETSMTVAGGLNFSHVCHSDAIR